MIQDAKLTTDELLHTLRFEGYTFFTGVPDSLHRTLVTKILNNVDEPFSGGKRDLQYIAAADEGNALATACGASLVGAQSVVLLQNSGLGNCLNPLTSLAQTYHIPTLMLITWRGQPSNSDEPQHRVMGQITPGILDLCGVRWEVFANSQDAARKQIARLTKLSQILSQPVALVMPKGCLASEQSSNPTCPRQILAPRLDAYCEPLDRKQTTSPVRFSSNDVLKKILSKTAEEDVLLTTTGFTSRAFRALGPIKNHFPMAGSMGCVASIGLGIALSCPGRKVIVIDGDGALLMRLGVLTTIGYYGPTNFIHIVLDNEAYESTGSQPSASSRIDFPLIALGAGYASAELCRSLETLARSIALSNRERSEQVSGPQFFLVKTELKTFGDIPRPEETSFEIANMFRKQLGQPHAAPKLEPSRYGQGTLFTPGPLSTTAFVRSAQLQDLGSRDQVFVEVTARLRSNLLGLLDAKGTYDCIPLQGSATFALEAAIHLLVRLSRRGSVLCLSNGAYGERLALLAKRLNIPFNTVEMDWQRPITASELMTGLERFPETRIVCLVHCETSSGIVNDAASVSSLAKGIGLLMLLDATSSFGGISLETVCSDVIVGSANKCIESVPGLGFAFVREEHLRIEPIRAAPTLSLDLYDQWKRLNHDGQWRFTPPVQACLALDRALISIVEKGGFAQHAVKYKQRADILREKLPTIGLTPLIDLAYQSNIILSFEGDFSYSSLYNFLAARDLFIYPSGIAEHPNSLRIGCIGDMHTHDVNRLVEALQEYFESSPKKEVSSKTSHD